MKLLEEIIKTYGKFDYYEMNTGRIFHLSEMQYHLYGNKTIIPVSKDDIRIENIELKGDWTK